MFYCLSLTNPPDSCPQCSTGCMFSDLTSSSCVSNCNNQACGYQNLQCLGSYGCYSFMSKYNDNNCNNTNCNPGCQNYYNNHGICPSECSKSCCVNDHIHNSLIIFITVPVGVCFFM